MLTEVRVKSIIFAKFCIRNSYNSIQRFVFAVLYLWMLSSSVRNDCMHCEWLFHITNRKLLIIFTFYFETKCHGIIVNTPVFYLGCVSIKS